MKKTVETKAECGVQQSEGYCFFVINDFTVHIPQVMMVKPSEHSDNFSEKSVLVVLY
jgi:hypothetical protein